MDTMRICSSCRKPLAADAPQGICPECLMKAGFGTAPGTEGGSDGSFVPPPVEAIAKLFPQLEVLELIGRGGMGAVYKARQSGLDRLVALKILPPRTGSDPGFAERFTREARALAKLNHPNIVGVYDFGQVSSPDVQPASAAGVPPGSQPITSLHYFLMEYVDEPNLRQVEQAGKLLPPQALQIIPQICEALQYAHDEGIVHRDIKPENVLLDKKGRVKIADFGLAKILGREPQDFRLTGSGQVMGTPNYMAPEQIEHPQEVDHRADLYSLGVVFYEMLTGDLPLGKSGPPSRKVQVDVRLDEVVMHALENEPARRYQHASQIKSDVETIATGMGSPGESLTESLAHARPGRNYRTRQTLFGLPLAHTAWGIDPATGRPRVAKGIVAVGPVAYGVIAVGFSAWGLFPVGLVAVGLNPVGLFAVGFMAVGLAAAGLHATGLAALALWRAVGLVAAGPSAIGLERIMVEKGMVGLLLVLAIVAAWLMDRLIRAIGSAAALPAGMAEGKGLAGASDAARGSTHRACWFWFLAVASVVCLLVMLVTGHRTGSGSARPPQATSLRVFTPADRPISGELTLTEDNAWAASCTTTQTFRLFEVPNPGVERCTVLYRAKLKTESLAGRAYLEMWCQFPGKGEFFSRGLGNTISGSSGWATCQTPFFLEAGQRPDLIRLNLVVEGPGKVFIKDVELTAAPSH
jgi:hypothetical protein